MEVSINLANKEGAAVTPPFKPSDSSAKIEEIIKLHGMEEYQLLAPYAADPDEQVRARAVRAILKAGRSELLNLDELVHDQAASVRKTFAETCHPVVDLYLEDLLRDTDASVVEAASFAAGELVSTRVTTLLIEIASNHQEPLCREAAVAALGVIGDPDTLDVVIEALSDKTYIRRRAVVALSAFEGPKVESALKRAMLDRDPQVRQLAEDLTRASPHG